MRPGAVPACCPTTGWWCTATPRLAPWCEAARTAGQELPELGLLGGDLCKTLGGLGDETRLRSPEAMRFPVDLGRVELGDGRRHWFVAHAILRHRAWVGRAVAVMNAQWLGDWDLGARAHPGDARLDVTDGRLPVGDLLKARKRVRTGTHLPHPGLRTSRVGHVELDLERTETLWLDGERVARVRHVTIEVEPDALWVVI